MNRILYVLDHYQLNSIFGHWKEVPLVYIKLYKARGPPDALGYYLTQEKMVEEQGEKGLDN